jgi:hypothetical protein
MEEKKKVGYFLPQPVIDAFEVVAGRMRSKREKWIVICAALIYYLEAPLHVQNDFIRRVKNADSPGGTFKGLVKVATNRSVNAGRALSEPALALPEPGYETRIENLIARGAVADRTSAGFRVELIRSICGDAIHPQDNAIHPHDVDGVLRHAASARIAACGYNKTPTGFARANRHTRHTGTPAAAASATIDRVPGPAPPMNATTASG